MLFSRAVCYYVKISVFPWTYEEWICNYCMDSFCINSVNKYIDHIYLYNYSLTEIKYKCTDFDINSTWKYLKCVSVVSSTVIKSKSNHSERFCWEKKIIILTFVTIRLESPLDNSQIGTLILADRRKLCLPLIILWRVYRWLNFLT